MDYEKAYKDALQAAKHALDCDKQGLVTTDRVLIERMFPELKESEDERIRKRLIEFFEDWGETKSHCWGKSVNKILTWLEKQKSVGEIVERCKNSWYNEGKIAGMLEGLTDDEKYQQGWHDALEKQGKESSWEPTKEQYEALDYAYDSCSDTEYEGVLETLIKDLHRLEKQGEKKPIMNVPTREVILAIWDLGNEWKELTNGDISTEYGTTLDYIQKHWHESEYYLREKQGEQKVIDKVEPKFKVGDWVVQENIGVYKVIEICESWYEVVDNKDKHYSIGFDKEYMCHLWTIEDAKDGDVLVSKYNKPFIYNGNYNDRFVDAHCGLNFDGKFKLAWENCSWTNNKNIHPASEEQCGLLSQKMKEAGYEWDMEKKELKLLISNGGDFESNNSKQNPTWSEEDDAYELFAISAVEDYYDEKNPLQKGLVDWLKSLKERLSK